MPEGTHVKCTKCDGWGSCIVQVQCTGCKGKGCRQCHDIGKVPTMQRCETCGGEGYIEAKPFRISYYDHG